MKNETLYWTIGGVAIALIALFAMSRSSGSSSSTTTSGGGVSASTLAAEVQGANSNAAAVEQTLLNDQTQYVIHSTDAQAGGFQSLVSAAGNELATIENNQTSRYAAGVNAAQQEYADQQNALSAQFEATQQTARESASNALALQEAQIAENVAHFQSDNAVTMARINHGSSFGNFLQSLIGGASNFFSSATGAGVLGVKP